MYIHAYILIYLQVFEMVKNNLKEVWRDWNVAQGEVKAAYRKADVDLNMEALLYHIKDQDFTFGHINELQFMSFLPWKSYWLLLWTELCPPQFICGGANPQFFRMWLHLDIGTLKGHLK